MRSTSSFLAALLLLGCESPPSYLVIEGPKQIVFYAPGESVDLRVKVVDRSGQTMSNPPLTWFSSNAEIAEVGQSGRVTARGHGHATVTALCGGVHNTIPIEVAHYQSLRLSEQNVVVRAGTSRRIEAQILDGRGDVVPGAVSWSSDNRKIATVDERGVVRGVSMGNTIVTATAKHLRASVTIRVPASFKRRRPPTS